MTSPARKPGFRLPWRTGTTDGDEPSTQGGEEPEPEATATSEAAPAAATSEAGEPKEAPTSPTPEGDGAEPGGEASATAPAGEATAVAAAPGPAPTEGPPAELLREMVEAMRGVAEQARVSSLADVRKGVEEAVASLRASGGERAAELRRRAEEDIAGIGEWAKAEAERIRREAESKVSGRRTQLDEQLKDQDGRTERDIEGVRGRVTDYERRLGEFFDQLKEVGDPASFAAAVNRMPRPPTFDTSLAGDGTSTAGGEGAGPRGEAPSAGGEASGGAGPPATEAGPKPPESGGDSGQGDKAVTDAKAGTAAIDAASGAPSSTEGDGEGGAAEDRAGEGTTMIVVKGLGSFGAITAFKQGLERTDGIGSVALALGSSGEFVYRTTHETGFDVQAAIAELEGGAAEFERDADGTLRVSVAPR